MKPLGLGEHGGISITREGGSYVAYVRYRDYAGRGHRVKRTWGVSLTRCIGTLWGGMGSIGVAGRGPAVLLQHGGDPIWGWLRFYAAGC
jgi:hypothetical protein